MVNRRSGGHDSTINLVPFNRPWEMFKFRYRIIIFKANMFIGKPLSNNLQLQDIEVVRFYVGFISNKLINLKKSIRLLKSVTFNGKNSKWQMN